MKRYFHRIAAVLACALLGLSTPAQAQEFDWLRTVVRAPNTTSGLTASPLAIADSRGNSYAFSWVRNSYQVNGLPPVTMTPGYQATLLVAFDSTGAVRWSDHLRYRDTTIHMVKITAATTDPAGNLYAVCTVKATNRVDTLWVGGQPYLNVPALNFPYGSDYFLIKWAPTGAVEWVRQGGGVGDREGLGLATNQEGDVFVTGSVRGTCSFGGLTVVGGRNGFKVAFCARFRGSTGATRWVKVANTNIGQTAYSEARSVTVDRIGRVHFWITGDGDNATRWDGHYLFHQPGPGSVLMLDANDGRFLRNIVTSSAFLFSGTNPQVATDEASNLYFVSQYFHDLQVGTVTLPGLPTAPLPYSGAIGVVKFDTAGTVRWARPLQALTDSCSLGGGLHSRTGVAVRAGRMVVCGTFNSGTLRLGGAVAPLPPPISPDALVVGLDAATGQAAWARTISGTGEEGSFSLGMSAGGGITVVGQSTSSQLRAGTLIQPLPGAAQGSLFVAHLGVVYNRVDGRVYVDTNADSTYTPGTDRPQNAILQVTPTSTTAFLSADAAQGGQYTGIFPAGSYALMLASGLLYHTVAPVTARSLTFSGIGAVQTGQDFVFTPIANQQDLLVYLTAVGAARPGFAVQYRLTAYNPGTVVAAFPTLHLTYDSLLTFVSASLPGTPSGSTFTWALGPLQPGETRDVDVLFQLAVTAPLGHVLIATAMLDPLAGDLTPADNTETDTLIVTGSYDPNDIAVNYATLTLADVQNATQPLDYTVRFQNMGTDTAFTVTLRDTLPAALLNLGTLQVLSASHSCTWRLGAGGVVTVSFPGINLPDRITNTLQSMGFVRFRVVPYTTLVAGDLIPNQAQIYFDFNAPVATNTALTTILNATGLAPDATSLTGGAWPNPATGALHVAVERPTGVALTLTLTDALGRTVRTEPVAAGDAQVRTTLDVRGLAPGLYIVRAEADGRRWSQRVVVR